MKTSLYIPFTEFILNNEDGRKILYENLVQSGPAYKLIVHESPGWTLLKEKLGLEKTLEIISSKKAEEYKEIVNRFFAPITEVNPIISVGGKHHPIENLTIDIRRALSYILIAHDYKARIYESDILKPDFKLSQMLEKSKGVFSEEAILRTKFVEKLLEGYTKSKIPTISVNQDERIFKDLMDLLKNEEIRVLSEKNFALGVGKARKDICVREIKNRVTKIVKNKWLPYLAEASTLVYYYSTEDDITKALAFLSKVGLKFLSGYNFNEYSPPIEDPKLFTLGSSSKMNLFSYKTFNYDFKILIPKRR